jgi:hypothetical protein
MRNRSIIFIKMEGCATSRAHEEVALHACCVPSAKNGQL